MIYGIISTPDIRRRATLDPGFERERERGIRALVKSFPWPPFDYRVQRATFSGFHGFWYAAYNSGMGLTNGTFFDSSRYRESNVKSRSCTRVMRFFLSVSDNFFIIRQAFYAKQFHRIFFLFSKFQKIRTNIHFPKESFQLLFQESPILPCNNNK